MNSSLSMVEAKLPPGFRFHPRDDELICDYLMKKVACCDSLSLLMDVDLNNCEPWDIPANACVGGKDWYFYSKRDRKYATGLRLNRATKFGYWKATGKDRPIHHDVTLVGMRKTLVFYQGRAPKGTKTNWVMHEFRLEGPLCPPKIAFTKEDWVLCRVFLKNKESTAKQCTESTCNDKNSSSLPPLMDSYISTFDKTQPNANQQVPCFSNFLPTFSHITHMDPNTLPKSSPTFGPTCLSPFSNEKGVLKAVLDQLTEMEGIISSESYLFNVDDLSAVWDPCY